MRGLVAAALLLCACARSGPIPCGDGYCPVGAICAALEPEGELTCVARADACADFPDGTPCEGDGRRLCIAGVCDRSVCGDGYLDALAPQPESCDDGDDNGDQRDVPCRSNCLPLRCGDGVVDSGELCDDGANLSLVEPDACREVVCRRAFCGDGVVDAGEAPTCFGAVERLSRELGPLLADWNRAADVDGDGAVDLIGGTPANEGTGLTISYGGGPAGWQAQRLGGPAAIDDVTAGDLDGDGRTDLLATGIGLAPHYYRATGPRSFAAPVAIGGTVATIDALLVDLDADGAAELITAESTGVFVRWSDAGVLTAAEPLLLGQGTLLLDAADFTGDGRRDLLLTGGLSIWAVENLGARALAAPAELPNPGFSLETLDVEVADLDGDGDADVLTNEGVYWLATPGVAAPFDAAKLLPMPTGLGQIASGDVDGDGDIDVAGLADVDVLVLFRNLGNAMFLDESFVIEPIDGGDPLLIDADHDGRGDFVSSAEDTVLLRGGDGLIGPPRIIDPGLAGSGGEVHGGDLDGDGDVDLVRAVGGQLAAIYGEPGAGIAPIVLESLGLPILDLAPLRFDDDAAAELLVLEADGRLGLWALARGTPPALRESIQLDAADDHTILDTGDVDADGREDVLILSAPASGPAPPALWLYRGRDDLALVAEPVSLELGSSIITGAELGDLDGDGRDDVLLATSNGLVWRRTLPDGTLAPSQQLEGSIGDFDLADIDGDGGDELVAASLLGDLVGIWELGDDGALVNVATLVLDGLLYQAPLGDVDGDGRADLLFEHAPEGVSAVLLSIGGGRFAGPFLVEEPVLLAIDVSGDGRVDLIVSDAILEGTLGLRVAGRSALSPR